MEMGMEMKEEGVEVEVEVKEAWRNCSSHDGTALCQRLPYRSKFANCPL